MKEIVTVVLKDGSEVTLQVWQRMYGLTDAQRIGKYFSLSEYRFMKDLEMYGKLVINEVLIRFMDGFREKIAMPVRVNSFNRSIKHQEELKQNGFRAATHSPHVVYMAMDIDTNSRTQTKAWVAALRKHKEDTGIQVRIGWKDYMDDGNTFIHVDVCPEFYASGQPYHNHPHPGAWEKAIEW